MDLRSIAVAVNRGRPEATEAADRLAAWAARRGVRLVEPDVWSADRQDPTTTVRDAGGVDLVVTLGGDGTFLRAVEFAKAADAPMIGVNVGRVGFLTETEPTALIPLLEATITDRAFVDERMTLTVRANRPLGIPPELDALIRTGRGPTLPAPGVRPGSPEEVGWGVQLDVTALNDVTFEKLSRDRQASIGVYVGSRLFMTYSADALVVASPTGSTAYSFAAGGPVLSPRARALVFTPVAAHMAFDRSLVLGQDEVVSVRVLEHSGQVLMTVDGAARAVLDPGDWVGVYAQPWTVRLLGRGRPDFTGRLRERFGLADSLAALADGTLAPTYVPDAPKPPELEPFDLPTVDLPEGHPAARRPGGVTAGP
jgi:NAD+ kinase